MQPWAEKRQGHRISKNEGGGVWFYWSRHPRGTHITYRIGFAGYWMTEMFSVDLPVQRVAFMVARMRQRLRRGIAWCEKNP